MREINEDSFYDIQHDDILNERLSELNVNEVEFYKALNKQIPKKMKLEINKDYRCPNCIALYENPQNDGILYCACCGQAIDWN